MYLCIHTKTRNMKKDEEKHVRIDDFVYGVLSYTQKMCHAGSCHYLWCSQDGERDCRFWFHPSRQGGLAKRQVDHEAPHGYRCLSIISINLCTCTSHLGLLS